MGLSSNDWRLEMVNQVRKGIFFEGSQVALSEYLDHWLKGRQSNIRTTTYINYRQTIINHINPFLGKIKLIDLRPEMIEVLYHNQQGLGIGNRTIQNIHAVLRCALNKAVKEELIYRNPCIMVDRPKVKKKEMKVLDEYQVRQLFIAARGTRLEVLVQIAVTTGLREGEILGLKWSDIDWQNKRLHIQRQVQRIPQEGLIFSEPKSAAGRRMITLGANIIEVLKIHANKQHFYRKLAGANWKEMDLIFPSSEGTPIDPRNLIRLYKKLLVEANLPDIRFHDLRHTSASLMLKQGVSAKVVQERLGHSDITLTLNTYSHLLPGIQEEAAEKMDEITAIIDVSQKVIDEKE
jgi:integrase